MFRLPALALIALLLAGCAVGPDYAAPKAPEFPAYATPSPGKATVTPATAWWKAFNDPLLDRLIERAGIDNLTLLVALSRIDQARATRAGTNALFYPQVDSSAQASRRRSSGNATATPVTTGTRISESGSAGFDAAWEIDLFGRVRRSVEAADASLESFAAEADDARLTLIGDIATNYVALRGNQRRLAIARETLKAQEDTAALTREKFAGGLVSRLDVTRAEGTARSTAAGIPTLETALRANVFRLGVLLGQAPGALLAELGPDQPIPTAELDPDAGIPAELARRRPDIRAAERTYAANVAEIGVATAALYPSFSIAGAIGINVATTDKITDPNSRTWSLGPSLSLPIFNAGRLRANVAVREASAEQSRLAYESTVLLAMEEVENALVAYGQERQRRDELRVAAINFREAQSLAKDLYAQGLASFLEVLDADRSAYSADDALATSEARVATNLVALCKALGGGWTVAR